MNLRLIYPTLAIQLPMINQISMRVQFQFVLYTLKWFLKVWYLIFQVANISNSTNYFMFQALRISKLFILVFHFSLNFLSIIILWLNSISHSMHAVVGLGILFNLIIPLVIIAISIALIHVNETAKTTKLFFEDRP